MCYLANHIANKIMTISHSMGLCFHKIKPVTLLLGRTLLVMFITLIEVMASWVDAYVQTHQIKY